MPRNTHRYDVFVSYSHRDAAFVREWLVPELKRAGLRTCLDIDDFQPGASLPGEIERAVLESRRTVVVLSTEYFESGWTELENILVQTLDPANRARRLIPLCLSPCDVPLRLRAFVRVDCASEDVRPAALARLIAALQAPAPRQSSKRRTRNRTPDFEAPTGALVLSSPYYVARADDERICRNAARPGTTTILEGPRRSGKSSLLFRAMDEAKRAGSRAVFVDFAALEDTVLESLPVLCRRLADAAHKALRTVDSPESAFSGIRPPKEALTRFLTTAGLAAGGGAVLFVLDEVDRLFGRPPQDDFFSLLRAWHNRRACDERWQALSMILAVSTDPRGAIRNLNTSPFDVGTCFRLADFDAEHVKELNGKYGRPLAPKDLAAFLAATGGVPPLVQWGLHQLASSGTNGNAVPARDREPIAGHLDDLRRSLEREDSLTAALRLVASGRAAEAPRPALVRLHALGLVTGPERSAKVRAELYAEHFREILL